MQASPQEKKSVDYLRNPSSLDENPTKSHQDRELNILLEQLRQVGQDQNEHY